MKICGDKILSYKIFVLLILWQDKPLGAIQKVGSLKRGGRSHWKLNKNEQGKGVPASRSVRFLKKFSKKRERTHMLELRYSPVSYNYNGSMKYYTTFTFHNFSFFSLHCPLPSLRLFSKNGYLFIDYTYVYVVISS